MKTVRSNERRDPINYKVGQIVEFHRRASGGFRSGEQWEVVRCASESVILVKDGRTKVLPLAEAKSFHLYTLEETSLAVGDSVRITKNFHAGAKRFRNNELCTVMAIDRDSITVSDGRVIKRFGPVHVDQGIAVTSHASQGKSVDQVIVSVPVAAFSQANEAQFYVSMSRARHAMHLYTDSKAALNEAVMRPSERLSPWELLSAMGETWERSNHTREQAFAAKLQRVQAAVRPLEAQQNSRKILCSNRSETKEREQER